MLSLNGCSNGLFGLWGNKDQSGYQKLDSETAADMNAQRSQFDAGKEPPLTVETRYAAGQLAESRNQPAAAVVQYQEALKLDPMHQPSLYRLAYIFTQAKQYEPAIQAWQQYVRATERIGGSVQQSGTVL